MLASLAGSAVLACSVMTVTAQVFMEEVALHLPAAAVGVTPASLQVLG